MYQLPQTLPSATLGAPADGAEPKRVVDLAAALEWLRTEHAVLLTALRQAEEEGMHRHAWQLSWALGETTNLSRTHLHSR
ncbi:hypothetical protein AB0O34_28815 [Sphaerisporangium sp. NPDC088356]|uniref:hypothetical protein n=1 Tax=Sphaerisporangium sp. NPDC088356 TaxID=3154871 RepID=UPI0034402E17